MFYMNYIDLTGDLPDAIELVRQEGGRLYAGKYRDSCHTVVIGNHCFTFWNARSKTRQLVKQLCETFNVPFQGQTGGRLARMVLKDIVSLPHKGTYWDRQYRAVAKGGEHWHYTFVNPNRNFYGVEFDLKSAYFSSLFAGKSLLYQPNIGWRDDNGSLDRLKALTPMFPKWFRLQLLGLIASWNISYYVRPKVIAPDVELDFKTSYKIQYGAAFNAVHRAIIRNYKIMKKVHGIGGKYIERMHTDSFLLNIECPETIEKDIFDYLAEKKAEVDIKSAGFSYFFDLNTGYIGKHFVGSKIDVLHKMKINNVKIKRDGGYNIVLTKYEQQELIKNKLKLLNEKPESLKVEDSSQLELFSDSVMHTLQFALDTLYTTKGR